MFVCVCEKENTSENSCPKLLILKIALSGPSIMSWKLGLMPLSLFSQLLSPFLLEQQVWLRWSRWGAGGSPPGRGAEAALGVLH